LWQFFQNGWDFFNKILRAYARQQIFIQLPATLTKLYHIERDHPRVHTPTRVSGVNLKHIGFLAAGAQCDILLNCAIQIALLN